MMIDAAMAFRQSEDLAFVAAMNEQFARDQLVPKRKPAPWPQALSARLQSRAEKRRKSRHWTLKARAPKLLPTLSDLARQMGAGPKEMAAMDYLRFRLDMLQDLTGRGLHLRWS